MGSESILLTYSTTEKKIANMSSRIDKAKADAKEVAYGAPRPSPMHMLMEHSQSGGLQ
jgi:hypothetical protein